MIKIENVEVMGWEHAIRGMRNPMNSWAKSDSYFGESDVESCSLCPHFNRCATDETFLNTQCMNIGSNDHELMMKLAKNGPVHAKYRRMITVYLDITAPLYWWKEFDTYKVGTVANSCSTMHKISEKEFTLEDFSCEHLLQKGSNSFELMNATNCSAVRDGKIQHTPISTLMVTIMMLNHYRKIYLELQSIKEDEFKIYPCEDVLPKDKTLSEARKTAWWQMIQLLPSSYNQRRTIMLNYEVLAGIYIWRKDHKLDEWREFCKWIETLPCSEIITGDRKENE